MDSTFYADIILPVPLPRLFTYQIPEEWTSAIVPGMRVVVPFGNKKYYSGVVYSLHDQKPEAYETKEIISILDKQPVVNEVQLNFWRWIADYYMCTLGEVYKAALPSGLKLESQTKVHYNADWLSGAKLNAKETIVLDYLAEKKTASIQDLNNITEMKNSLPVIKSLLDKQAVFVSERLKDSYKPKTKKVLQLAPEYSHEQKLQNAFTELSRAKKQLNALMVFFTMIGGAHKNNYAKTIDKNELKKKSGASTTVLNELISKGLFIEIETTISRLDTDATSTKGMHNLNPIQQKARQQIQQQFALKDAVLLHGVTSSGKTEIYIQLIQEQIKQGKQVLYLLPEIALTTQITSRLKLVFGNQIGIYHSKYSDAERVEVWNDILNKENYKVVIGVRSSIFLPFDNLGLIIIDEEHENTYKQFDPAPRYHARDAALVLAHMHKAKVLLGTATPSIETYRNTQVGKYGLVELFERFEGIKMPRIQTVNVREEKRKKKMSSDFSPLLVEEVGRALENGEQAILFQNRRGFSPYLECAQCSWVPKCKYCDVSLTYHKHINQLVCHYCGHSNYLPRTCSACESPALHTKGFGTEKIEEDIRIIFPEAKVVRMDLDTSRTRKSHENIIRSFERSEVDILIGTQMISKGLDFDKVSVVGILNADSMLNYPDFRAFERSFQMMAQVGGRAGRKNKQGTVIIQTANPDNPVILDVVNNNFKNHYQNELAERETYKYPPFYRLIYLTIKHKNANIANQAADYFGQYLRGIFNERVVGPQAPPISKIQNWHIRKVMLKLESGVSLPKIKTMLRSAIDTVVSHPGFKAVVIQADVDPM
ncbi:replication restart DNA helicase PriA [Saccharicrinis carchari]|uniref:Replication restart protein PriA n=1 Tax=Saccharicrinis carchari TaxID=1168039 RepID=A0A521ELM8_SACCC|nr:primosomal protein N' [Saccharicrinis carchari]SMO84826.1 replication restart DNA helicase PriA [Saccharicrinis carchari]